MIEEPRRDRWSRVVDWLPEILFVSFTTVAGLLAHGRWIHPFGDTGFSWSLAHRISLGETLYRDVYLAYGPLSPYLLGGLASLVGSSAFALLLWNWAPAIVAGVLLLRCGRPFLSVPERVACAGLVIAVSVFAPGPGRLVFPYYTGVVHALALSLGAILLVRDDRPGGSMRSLIAGLLAGLAFCAKQEIGVAALAALVAAQFPRPREVISHGRRAVGGFLLAVAPGAGLALSNASLRSLREDNHLWPADLTPPAELGRIYRLIAGMKPVDWFRSVREDAWSLLLVLLAISVVAMLLSRETRISPWQPALLLGGVLLVWGVVEGPSLPRRVPIALSVIVAFGVALFALVRRDLTNRPRLIAISLFAGLVGTRTAFSPRLSGAFDGPAHFAGSLTWVVFLCVVAPALLARAGPASVRMRRITAILLVAVAWFGAVAGARTLSDSSKLRVETRKGGIFLPPKEAFFFGKLRENLRAGETALVIPEINAVDALFGVRSVSPLLHLMPGWLDSRVEGELIRRLQQSPPDVVVIFDRPMPEFGFARFGKGYGVRLEEWILRNYRPVLSDRGSSILRRPSLRSGSELP